MSQKPQWIVYAEGIGKVVGLVAIINGALIIFSDPKTPVGGFYRNTWTFFFETYQDCIEKAETVDTEVLKCKEKHGVPL